MRFLDVVRKLPLFEVETRKLQRQSSKEIIEDMNARFDSLNLCETCLPLVKSSWIDHLGKIQTKEKGIDVMIAVDMMKKAIINKECDCCFIVSGDADFLPALDIINTAGVKVGSASLAKGYAYALRNKYPFFILDVNFIKNNCLRTSLKNK